MVLDDWLDGVDGRDPDAELEQLRQGMGAMMSGGMMDGGRTMGGMSSSLLGGDAGDVAYPHYLINGRLPTDPDIYSGRPAQRLRIRLLNAGSDTAFRSRSAAMS